MIESLVAGAGNCEVWTGVDNPLNVVSDCRPHDVVATKRVDAKCKNGVTADDRLMIASIPCAASITWLDDVTSTFRNSCSWRVFLISAGGGLMSVTRK